MPASVNPESGSLKKRMIPDSSPGWGGSARQKSIFAVAWLPVTATPIAPLPRRLSGGHCSFLAWSTVHFAGAAAALSSKPFSNAQPRELGIEFGRNPASAPCASISRCDPAPAVFGWTAATPAGTGVAAAGTAASTAARTLPNVIRSRRDPCQVTPRQDNHGHDLRRRAGTAAFLGGRPGRGRARARGDRDG